MKKTLQEKQNIEQTLENMQALYEYIFKTLPPHEAKAMTISLFTHMGTSLGLFCAPPIQKGLISQLSARLKLYRKKLAQAKKTKSKARPLLIYTYSKKIAELQKELKKYQNELMVEKKKQADPDYCKKIILMSYITSLAPYLIKEEKL